MSNITAVCKDSKTRVLSPFFGWHCIETVVSRKCYCAVFKVKKNRETKLFNFRHNSWLIQKHDAVTPWSSLHFTMTSFSWMRNVFISARETCLSLLYVSLHSGRIACVLHTETCFALAMWAQTPWRRALTSSHVHPSTALTYRLHLSSLWLSLLSVLFWVAQNEK